MTPLMPRSTKQKEIPLISYSKCYVWVPGTESAPNGPGLTSALFLISHGLPPPWPLVILPDRLFLKPYSHSSLSCLFTSRWLFEVVDSYFLRCRQPHRKCSVRAGEASECPPRPLARVVPQYSRILERVLLTSLRELESCLPESLGGPSRTDL